MPVSCTATPCSTITPKMKHIKACYSRHTRLSLTGKIMLITIGLCSSSMAVAHLPVFEGERVRNDNHFTTNGFAQPVRGACDIATGAGPGAGSANIYLGPGNTPPNFFCGFTSQDDWTFELPADIIETSRVPAPDPRDLIPPESNLSDLEKVRTLEEGYIPCSPTASPEIPTAACPRSIANPQDGSSFNLPGLCVDNGQPGERDERANPDGIYHCALLPGAPRPRESSVFFSTLTTLKDVDWAVYHYDPIYDIQPIVGAPQVPACAENLGSFISFAYAGPINMLDGRSGEPLFTAIEEAGELPDEIKNSLAKLPETHGIRVTRPNSFEASATTPRTGYASGFGQNGWLLAPDSVVQCIDDFETCLADTSGDLNRHYAGNDLFFVDEDEPVTLYLMWWVDLDAQVPGFNGGSMLDFLQKLRLTDASMTTGVVDQFIVGDFINIGTSVPFSAAGRYVHGACNDPRTDGAANVIIETN